MRQKALDYLSRREHSRYELQQKLLRHEFDKTEIEILLDELAKNNLQCDKRFTEMYIHSRRQAGFGPIRIEAELRDRKVSDDIIAELLDRHSTEWNQHMMVAWQEKFFNKKGTQHSKEKAAQFRFLSNRGFVTNAINKMLFSDTEFLHAG